MLALVIELLLVLYDICVEVLLRLLRLLLLRLLKLLLLRLLLLRLLLLELLRELGELVL